MIKLCASAYVYPSVATPLFIALWQCPKVTAISNMMARFTSLRLMTLCYMQHTCEESSQSQFHFLLPECISLTGHESNTTPWQAYFFLLHSCCPACLVLSFNYMFLNKPACGTVEIQVLVLPTEALPMPLGYVEWPKGLLPRGQSKQTVVLLMLSHM